MSEAAKVKMLVVDDDPTVRSVCSHMLERWGYEVVAVNGASQALARARHQPFDLVLTDIKMPEMAGTVLIDRLKQLQPEIVPVVMTGFPTAEAAIDSVRRGAYEFIPKPFVPEELQAAIRRVLVRREEEMRRIQRQFAANLLSLQKELGSSFDLPSSIEAIIEPTNGKGSAVAGDAVSAGATAATAVGRAGDESGTYVVLLCEPIPRNLNILKASDNYQQFRIIHAAHKALNAQFSRAKLPAAVRLAVVNRPAELPRQFRRYQDQVCCVIFGPNFAVLETAMVRLLANSGQDRQVVVCHNPQRMHFPWEQLVELRPALGVHSLRSSADERESSSFWIQFFAHELRPLIERRVESKEAPGLVPPRPLPAGEASALLARDRRALDLLPGFPPVCQQVLKAIDEGKSYGELAELIRFDAGLQASIVRTANLTRFGALQHIETLPLALSMIGLEEIRKLLVSKVMEDLSTGVAQVGFQAEDFLLHSATTAYLAQLLSLDVESPDKREQEILTALRLPACVRGCLRSWRLWERFPTGAAFDPFTAGVLHDVGKLVSAVCYHGTLPLILHEIERANWRQSSRLECEATVLGGFQHPAMAGALFDHWGLFPAYSDPIRCHHEVQTSTLPAGALVALANIMAQGIHPFSRAIDIPREYRKAHLDPTADAAGLTNPLPALYQGMVESFERTREAMGLSCEVLHADEVTFQASEDLLQAARAAVEQDAQAYPSVLLQQNPELASLEERLRLPAGDLIAFSLVLRESVVEHVQQLWQVINPKRT